MLTAPSTNPNSLEFSMNARTLALAALCFALTGPLHAQFAVNTTDVPAAAPGNDSETEQVDFGDLDLDGDWDAVFADGGDAGSDQNRVWINLGGLQGGVTGQFEDQTDVRMPAILDQSRDVELADIDADGDLDLYVANTASLSTANVDRFHINVGGRQGGSLGYFVDETASRWIGLGGPGSSVWPDLVQPGGGFYDWTSDGEFADLDNDGDLDLFKSTVGSAHSGLVPSRIFLNDGNGYFEEFNPAGVQLTGINLSVGSPAIWAEGLQQVNTADTSGAFADISAVAVDSDLMDVDGDLDLDILMGDRENDPRLFHNRLEGQLLAFRDLTGGSFAGDHSTGGGNYEQELGDLDGDGDVDLFGLNWLGFTDRTFENDGSGFFSDPTSLAGSGADDEEGDFLDYDNDGDLDLLVGNFSGSDKLYRNDLVAGEFTLEFLGRVVAGAAGGTTRDIEVADLDGDGDYDAMTADRNDANDYYENVTDVPDVHAPYLPALDVLGDGPSALAGRAVRAQVYDNAPYYITWYNETALEVHVDGKLVDTVPMRSSGGQVFRGEVPGNLVGAVTYRVVSSDEYGNTGASAEVAYAATGPVGSSVGTGSNGPLGEPVLRALSTSFSGTKTYLAAENVSPGAQGFVAFARNALTPGVNLGNGLVVNVSAPFIAVVPVTANGEGCSVVAAQVPAGTAGLTVAAQFIALDGVGGATWASSKALLLPLL